MGEESLEREAGQSVDLYFNIPFTVMQNDWLDGADCLRVPPAAKHAYMEALLAEVRGFADDFSEWDVTSITFGGGSVSALDEADVRHFGWGLNELIDLSKVKCCVAAVEPGLLSSSLYASLRALGCNYYNLRYFSSDPLECERLGVPASEIEMAKTRRVLECGGAPSVGLQIAVGFTGQTEKTLLRTLREAYIEPLHHFELVYPRAHSSLALSENERAELADVAFSWLVGQGFERYTQTCFAKPGRELPCEQNRFAQTNQICFGVGTTSMLDGLLWSNTPDFDTYVRFSDDPERITVAAAQLDDEARESRAHAFAEYHLS